MSSNLQTAASDFKNFLTRDPEQSTTSTRMRVFLGAALVTLLAFTILTAYLSPFGYMAVTSLKDLQMISNPSTPVLPSMQATFTYEGEELDVFFVPLETGVSELALLQPGREASTFIDPSNPSAGVIEWEGRWRTLDPVFSVNPRWENYAEAWDVMNFPLLLRNTLGIALIGVTGTLISSIAVAYGFSRFRIPYKNVLFLILVATIILPRFVTLVPTYAMFTYIGWVGTWLPLIVPHFFSNAYNIFLLRQFFLGIPRDLDEAAMIDGASPPRILVSVIVPQAIPAIVAVALNHFFFSWNDFFEPLIYLSSVPDLQPLSVGMQIFNALYAQQPHLIQASALLGMALPLLIFFMLQRVFLQGAAITGAGK